MNMFAKIKFNKDLKSINDHEINQISDAFSLNVKSAVDSS